jgi:hypothetical protein
MIIAIPQLAIQLAGSSTLSGRLHVQERMHGLHCTSV